MLSGSGQPLSSPVLPLTVHLRSNLGGGAGSATPHPSILSRPCPTGALSGLPSRPPPLPSFTRSCIPYRFPECLPVPDPRLGLAIQWNSALSLPSQSDWSQWGKQSDAGQSFHENYDGRGLAVHNWRRKSAQAVGCG